MNILIKSAKVVAPASSYHGKTVDILIENGIISEIAATIPTSKNVKLVEYKNLHLSPGWIDMQAHFCDPGYEHKEDLESGIHAAAAGGFTDVVLVPSTNPPVHTKSQVQYIKKNTTNAVVNVYPTGTLSYKQEGKELSEMYDMQQAGAIAFSDDKKTIANAGLLTRALLYSKTFDGTILTYCNEKSISHNGKMNEGITSTKLGIEGIPALAEELMVIRNLFIAEYTDTPIHISTISTKKSVDLIREAKAKGLKVTASVTAYNLTLNDQLLEEFDSNYKLEPPLRTQEDVLALQAGLADGTIDAITSDHRPQDIESKEVEFSNAKNGMIGLETAFALLNTHKGKLKLEAIIKALTNGPRNILKLKPVSIVKGEPACITLFDPVTQWKLEEKHLHSKSRNTPFINTVFTGKVIGLINKKQLIINKN